MYIIVINMICVKVSVQCFNIYDQKMSQVSVKAFQNNLSPSLRVTDHHNALAIANH